MEITPENCLHLYSEINDKSASEIVSKLQDCIKLGETFLSENGADRFLDELSRSVRQCSQIFFSRTLLSGEPFMRLKRQFNQLLFRVGYRDRRRNVPVINKAPFKVHLHDQIRNVRESDSNDDGFSFESYLILLIIILILSLLFFCVSCALIRDIKKKRAMLYSCGGLVDIKGKDGDPKTDEGCCCNPQSYYCTLCPPDPRKVEAKYKGIIQKYLREKECTSISSFSKS